MSVAKIFLDLAVDSCFDYLIPPELAAEIDVGSQVTVCFGSSIRNGIVGAIEEESNFPRPLKTIIKLTENRTKLPAKLIELGKFMAEYYCCSSEQAMRSLLPAAVRAGKIKEKTEKYYTLNPQHSAIAEVNSAKQRKVIEVLKAEKELNLKMLTLLASCGGAVVKKLIAAKVIEVSERCTYRSPFNDEILSSSPHILNSAQQKALDAFSSMLDNPSSMQTMLLFGATNSGKTEVYLQAIAKVLELGKSAIVLVPEISLTPQTVRRFRARFGNKVSVMHSKLTEAERFDQWNMIRRNEVSIAIGARSALFAPFENLGLIVVDEEHESSYKQSESPRYHARDVAVMRAKIENATVILGSATPSFETYKNALDNKYLLCEMPFSATAGAVSPRIEVVDLKLTKSIIQQSDGEGELKSNLFSPMLINSIHERLERAEQCILFLNRRGFARQLMCDECGYVACCSECSAAYTFHKKEALLSCHFCNATIPAPEECFQCGSKNIRYSGIGTEKIENIAHAIFPSARIARMDSDTMRIANAHETILHKLERREIDILIGTQMIAKGLHFPNITLVGVINADQSLYIPDFRSAERTFALLTQVAGRAGRGDRPGEVLIQTFSPHNEAILLAVQNDYRGFYNYDMAVRELLKYPPFGHMLILHLRSEDSALCAACAAELYRETGSFIHSGIISNGVTPSPVERIKNKFRYQIIFRGDKLKNLRAKLRAIAMRKHYNGKVEVYIDADPQSLL